MGNLGFEKGRDISYRLKLRNFVTRKQQNKPVLRKEKALFRKNGINKKSL